MSPDVQRPLLVGIGNRYRGDDGVGLVVAARVRAQAPPGVAVMEQPGEAGALLACLGGREAVLLVDAVSSGAAPGTVHRLVASEGPLPAGLRTLSSHGLGAATAVELLRALGQLPRRLVLYGIEGADFACGEGLSPEVARAADDLVPRLLEELREMTTDLEADPCTSSP